MIRVLRLWFCGHEHAMIDARARLRLSTFAMATVLRFGLAPLPGVFVGAADLTAAFR